MRLIRRHKGSGINNLQRGDPRRYRAYGLAALCYSHLGITLNGSNVSTWADTAGIRNATQGNSAQQPLYVASDSAFKGYPVLEFVGDATNPKWLNFASSITSSTSTCFVVCNKTVTATSYIVPLRVNEYDFLIRSSSTDRVGFFLNTDTLHSTFSLGSTPAVLEGVVRAANDVDTVPNGSSQTKTTGSSYLNGLSAIGYGGGGTGNGGTQRIAAVVPFTAVVPAAQRARIRKSLAARYGISVT